MIEWIITREDGGAMYSKRNKREYKKGSWMYGANHNVLLRCLSTKIVNHSTRDTNNNTSDDNARPIIIILSHTRN